MNPILKFRTILEMNKVVQPLVYSLKQGLHTLITEGDVFYTHNFNHTMITKSREAVDCSESSY